MLCRDSIRKGLVAKESQVVSLEGFGAKTDWFGGKVTMIVILKLNSVAWVHEPTIPTERQPLVCEVSANVLRLEGYHVVLYILQKKVGLE
jgi:hypothetical protein